MIPELLSFQNHQERNAVPSYDQAAVKLPVPASNRYRSLAQYWGSELAYTGEEITLSCQI